MSTDNSELSVPSSYAHTDFIWFAIVVDGEFTGKIGMVANPSPALAGLRSNPTMIEMTNEQSLEVGLGWLYDGTTFVLPTEE
jgi:hypothetical protein